MSAGVVFLRGQKIVLRPVNQQTDAELFVQWFNDPEVRCFLKRNRPLSLAEEQKWLTGLIDQPNDVVLVIATPASQLLDQNEVSIGLIGIHRIDWPNGVGTLGATIGCQEYWNRGFGFDAEMTMLNYAFNTLGLRKVCASVWSFNKRSERCVKKCGAREEGRRVKQILREGKYHDEIVLAIFKEDWQLIWEKYQAGG